MEPTVSPWLFAANAIFGLLGRQQAQAEANRAAALGERQMALVEPYVRRQFKRREEIFEPVEEEAMGRLTDRMRRSPWYAAAQIAQARNLRRPLSIAY